jgi:hypothetical protein
MKICPLELDDPEEMMKISISNGALWPGKVSDI